MTKFTPGLALASLAFGSIGGACSSDDGGSEIVTFSCRYSNYDRTDDRCFEFVGPAGPSLEGLRDVCIQFSGTAGSGCARDDVSGSCTFPKEGSRSIFFGLDDGELTLIMQLCEDSNGVWSAG